MRRGPGALVKLLLDLLPEARVDRQEYNPLFQMAIIAEDRVCVKMLLDRGIDINAVGNYYGTPLQCAARIGDVELVKRLLELGAGINALQGNYGTALRAAVAGDYKKIVNILLNSGADVNLREMSEHTSPRKAYKHILSLCLQVSNFSMFALLLAAGADINAEEGGGKRILIEACSMGDSTTVQLMLDRQADINATISESSYNYGHKETTTALHKACEKGHQAVVSLLLHYGADIELQAGCKPPRRIFMDHVHSETSKTPLQVAATEGHASIVRSLIQAGANIDHCSFYGSALSIAAGADKVEVVETLLEYHAFIYLPLQNTNALAEACRFRCTDVIDLLLAELTRTEEEEVICKDTLASAALSKEDKSFETLLGHLSSITPSMLVRAAAADLPGSVLTLLRRGVDPNCDADSECRAIHSAAFQQNLHVVDLLLKNGAEVNAECPKYGNALQAGLEGYAKSVLGYPREIAA